MPDYKTIELHKGASFLSRWYDGVTTIRGFNVELNELYVTIHPKKPGHNSWDETWNYEHTQVGLSRGEYFGYTKPTDGEPT